MASLERAIAIAAEAHAGQVDKGGSPYVLHPLRVMLAVEGEDAKIAAVLHDVLEDCPTWTASRLRFEGFSPDVLCALDALTRRRSEGYAAFVARLGWNDLARQVKLADLADNSDLSRLRKVTPKDRERAEKYQNAIAYLESLTATTTEYKTA